MRKRLRRKIAVWVILLLGVLCWTSLLWAENRLITAGGITQGTADSLYVNVAGDTMTGPLLLPDGSSGSPSAAFASEPGTGWWLAKALRHAWTIEGTGTVMTMDVSTLDYDGSVLFGKANSNFATFFGDTVNWLSTNDITHVNSSDVVFTGQSQFVIASEAQITDDLDAQAEVFVGASLHTVKGADVSSGSTLTIPRDGNYFDITGTTTINHMGNSGWIIGVAFTFQFDASVTVTHNAGSPPLNTLPFLLQGGVDFNASAGDTVGFVHEGAAFREVSRTLADEEYVTTRSPIVVMFGGGTDSPHFNTTNTSYTTAGLFLFGGTTALGTPSKIKAIGFKDAGPTSWDIQVLDITNVTTVVTKTGNTGTAAEIVDLGALSNLPAAEAIFEVQIKRTGGLPADFVFVHSTVVEF